VGFFNKKINIKMSSLSKPEVLLVIPVYNHSAKLCEVVQKAIKGGWEVLVVNDGSTDDTLSQLYDIPCDIYSLDVNKGKGAAIVVGAKWAKEKGYKAIVTVDADGQLNPDEAHFLLSTAQKEWPGIVIGARRMDQSTVPKASIFGRHFSNFWVRLECGRDLPDTQSGFRLYPVSELLSLPIRAKRYDFEVEVLVRAAWAGLPINSVEVSVDYPVKGERVSHFHQIKDNFRLTVLHTRLVLRTLNPIPHRKIFKGRVAKKSILILHPVKLIKQLCREHDSTFQLSIAAWLGIFLGALPLIAVHTIVIIYVAHKLHLNKIAAVASSQLCAPPIVPVLCIQVGFFLRTGTILTDLNWETLVLQIHQRLWEYFLGSLIVGPLLGLFVALLTYFTINKLRKGPETACGQP
jgi:glycosyltransferase involved in cell wall biosynthesis